MARDIAYCIAALALAGGVSLSARAGKVVFLNNSSNVAWFTSATFAMPVPGGVAPAGVNTCATQRVLASTGTYTWQNRCEAAVKPGTFVLVVPNFNAPPHKAALDSSYTTQITFQNDTAPVVQGGLYGADKRWTVGSCVGIPAWPIDPTVATHYVTASNNKMNNAQYAFTMPLDGTDVCVSNN